MATYKCGDRFEITGRMGKKHPVRLLMTKGCVAEDGNGCIWEFVLLSEKHMVRWNDSRRYDNAELTMDELMLMVDPANKGNKIVFVESA